MTRTQAVLIDLALGDSVAVDGVCLTVEALLPEGFIATASPETCRRTTLGQLGEGAIANLETSLRVGSKIGGHFVTGHVDGQGQLKSAEVQNNTWLLTFSASPQVARYVVLKGSIAVNGISLTVAGCSPAGDWFSAAVIPVTYQETNLQHLLPGTPVNLEGDVLGKYVERFARLGTTKDNENSALTDLSIGFLADHGYL